MYHFTNNYFKYHQNTTPGYADQFHINILLTILLYLMSPVTVFDAPRYIKLSFGFPVCVLVRPYVRPPSVRPSVLPPVFLSVCISSCQSAYPVGLFVGFSNLMCHVGSCTSFCHVRSKDSESCSENYHVISSSPPYQI